MKTGETRQKPEGHFDGPATIPDKRDLGEIESVSFHNPKPDKSQGHFDGNQEKPKRKEINLAELRKALEESLGKKEQSISQDDRDEGDKEQPEQSPKSVELKIPDNKPVKSSEEELKERIEQEKGEDKIEDSSSQEERNVPGNSELPKKKVIKPGETVKL